MNIIGHAHRQSCLIGDPCKVVMGTLQCLSFVPHISGVWQTWTFDVYEIAEHNAIAFVENMKAHRP